MASAQASQEDLPEPLDLHARFSAHRELDWGDPIPSREHIAKEFGTVAAARSLKLLAEVAEVEQAVTEDFVASVRPGTVAYQLKRRVKSPQSLARKLSTANAHRATLPQPEDLLRYTVVAAEPDDLVEAASGTVASLRSRGWAMESAHHSYVEGSRYKGIHAFLQAHGVVIELQIHSRESIDVKTRTTPLYEIERDPRQDKEDRTRARDLCIALSEGMRQPTGIDGFGELGGVPVAARSYGKSRGGPAARPDAGSPSARTGSPAQQRTTNIEQRKGTSR